jgi:hypothetical protein
MVEEFSAAATGGEEQMVKISRYFLITAKRQL